MNVDAIILNLLPFLVLGAALCCAFFLGKESEENEGLQDDLEATQDQLDVLSDLANDSDDDMRERMHKQKASWRVRERRDNS